MEAGLTVAGVEGVLVVVDGIGSTGCYRVSKDTYQGDNGRWANCLQRATNAMMATATLLLTNMVVGCWIGVEVEVWWLRFGI